MSPLSLYASAFLISLTLSLAITPVIRNIAIRKNFVAVPKDDRWHRKPTALFGGVGIFFSMTAAWIGISLVLGYEATMGSMLPLGIGCLLVFSLGLVDDIVDIKPHHKLLGQIVIASFLVVFGFQVQWFTSLSANLFFSILWIVGITNAFNLLDNMDGLAAGTAILSGFFLFFSSYGANAVPPSVCLAALLGAVLGFLVYNFHPASIFMGDSGSMVIGLALAGLTTKTSGLMSVYSGRLALILAVPILILFIPIMDTVFVSIIRRLFGRPISKGGRDHSSHRIVAIGFSEPKAVILLYGFTIIAGLLAVAMTRYSLSVSLAMIAVFLLFSLFFWIYLAKVKVYDEGFILSDKKWTPILIDLTYKKKLFEMMLDLAIIPLAYWIAYLVRFERSAYSENFHIFFKSLPIVIICQLFSFYTVGVYRGIWMFLGLRDVLTYIKGVTLGTVMVIIGNVVIYRFEGFSRTLFIIYWMILLILVITLRFSFRFFEDVIHQQPNGGIKTIIYGAGAAGQFALQEIERNKKIELSVVGFIDDDVKKQGQTIYGYPILGGLDKLEGLIQQFGLSTIVVSSRKISKDIRDKLEKICGPLGVQISELKISIE
jgi:UDP-GlcNAc:undecaprenyl-phosphate GlcNAc-1-phosphate transferase